MTPEGLNSRLTFLNQCMRQGPSIYDKKTDKNGREVGIQPQNLSFGRPPVLILRIGDFIHTKIIAKPAPHNFTLCHDQQKVCKYTHIGTHSPKTM